MKIVIVANLMSGFLDSIQRRVWNPTGCPALYKFIEQFDTSEHNLKIYLTVKNPAVAKKLNLNTSTAMICLDRLSSPIRIVSCSKKISSRLASLRSYFSGFNIFVKIIREILSDRPDILYIDRGNVAIAAFIARFTRIPVVLRLYGVTPAMHDLLHINAPSHYFYRWAYRSPFKTVIATRDGSIVRGWLDQILRQGIKYEVLLSGVDIPNVKRDFNTIDILKKIEIVHLGRLEAIKGIEEFIDAIIALPENIQRKIHVTLVGTGSLEKKIKNKIELNQMNSIISLQGEVSHDKIHEILIKSHLYVSLNKQGNLSNANIEAMKSGLCMILLDDYRSAANKDSYDDILPESAVIKIKPENMVESLKEAITDLVSFPEKIVQYQQAIQGFSKIFKTWKERMDYEKCLLEEIVKEKKCHI